MCAPVHALWEGRRRGGARDGLIRTSVAPVLLITQQRPSRCVLASPTITIRGIYVLEMEGWSSKQQLHMELITLGVEASDHLTDD